MDENEVKWRVTLHRSQSQDVILNDSFCAFNDKIAEAASKLARPDMWETHENYYDYEIERVDED